jgi:methionyl-tRNA formyltransferase
MRIAIVGDGRLAMNLMEPLLASKHEVVALVQNGRKAGKIRRFLREAAGRLLGPLAGIAGLALRNGIPVVWVNRMTEEELAPLRATRPDVILVGGFAIILKKPILELPRIGCINMHSSLLPKHRGPNPFAAVILAGDEQSGVTFHQIDEGIDTGPILEQYPFPICPQDTGLEVYKRACEFAGLHVAEVMDRIEQRGMYGRPQDEAAATYDKRLKRTDSYVDWTEPARAIERKVRGVRPFLVGRFRFRGYTVTTTRVRFEETKTDAAPGTILSTAPFVRIATGEGVITLLAAYAAAPVPWIWPAWWNKVKAGERVA